MWGKLHRELIVITIISVLILAVSFAFNFSASQKDILERQTYDYLLDAAHHTKVILHTEIQRQNELLDIVLRNAPRYEGHPVSDSRPSSFHPPVCFPVPVLQGRIQAPSAHFPP